MPFMLRDLPLPERPRERLQLLGPQALSVPELLALILGQGIQGQSVLASAQAVLAQFGSLDALAESSLEDLMHIKGLGLAKACQLLACFELANRWQLEQTRQAGENQRSKAFSAVQAAGLARSKIKDFNKEHCLLLSFNVRGKIIAVDGLSIGILNANLVHPRETFGLGIKRHASSLILVHNHPSGDLEPSVDDLHITERLVTAGKIMGIELLDHLIISRTAHYSFKEKNLF